MSELRLANLTEELAAQCAALELAAFPHADPDELLGEEDIRAYARTFPEGFFVVLDGDSVMSGTTLVRLTLAMQREEEAGLIQTVPRLTGAVTLLQHLQQFASNVYGPSVAAGLAFWHRDQGNYWGHNAIIRTRAFAEAAGLPTLPGRQGLATGIAFSGAGAIARSMYAERSIESAA